MRGIVRPALVILGTAVAYAAANRLTESWFRVTPELSLLYPPSGLGVAATMLFGPAAAAGVGLGTFLTPWTSHRLAELLFTGVNVLEALFPWLLFEALRRRGTFRRADLELRTPRARTLFFVAGVAVNTGLAALAGNTVAATLGSATSGFLRGSVYWWAGDASAVLMLGWPLLELVLLARRQARLVRARRRHAAFAAARRARAAPGVPAPRLLVAVVLAWAVAVLVVLASGVAVPAAGVMFSFPVMVAAYAFGFRGGLLSGAALGWVTIAWAMKSAGGNPDAVIAASLGAIDRAMLGLLTGGLFEANRRLIRRLKGSYAALKSDLAYMAGVLTAAVESRDPYTEGHMQRVSVYSVRIARRLGLAEEEVEEVRLSALLHDIGKLGVPDSILFKPEPLHGEDLEKMRAHAAIGARIAGKAGILRNAVPAILAHQERFDGDTQGPYPGYPQGLRGEAIPLASRIIAVADAYDTMTTNRPYRLALGRERALAVLAEERGRQFDPDVVDAFLADLEDRRHRKATEAFSIRDVMAEPGAAELPPGRP
jgi:HD-GYP domain-containing protein (c-di-GMP phosphodiesterase class II)